MGKWKTQLKAVEARDGNSREMVRGDRATVERKGLNVCPDFVFADVEPVHSSQTSPSSTSKGREFFLLFLYRHVMLLN